MLKLHVWSQVKFCDMFAPAAKGMMAMNWGMAMKFDHLYTRLFVSL